MVSLDDLIEAVSRLPPEQKPLRMTREQYATLMHEAEQRGLLVKYVKPDLFGMFPYSHFSGVRIEIVDA